MKKKLLTLLVASTVISSILIGCGKENVEPTTNEIGTVNENTATPTPTEYIDYDNPLEVGGVSGMGVSSVTITPENEQYLNDYSGIIEYSYPTEAGVDYHSRAYVYSINEYKAYMETDIALGNGNKINFSWIGETNIGTHSEATENGIVLYSKDKKTAFSAWNGSTLQEGQFELYKNTDMKTQMPKLDKNAKVEEGWEEIISDNELTYIYATTMKTDDITYKGYKKTILNKEKNIITQFYILQTEDVFDEDNAYETIFSISLRDEDDVLLDKITTTLDMDTTSETNSNTSENKIEINQIEEPVETMESIDTFEDIDDIIETDDTTETTNTIETEEQVEETTTTN